MLNVVLGTQDNAQFVEWSRNHLNGMKEVDDEASELNDDRQLVVAVLPD